MDESEAPLTVESAASEIARLGGLQEALRRRTSGITWMIWGIATPAIFVSYNFLGVLLALGVPEDSLGPWFMLAWAPWVAMGMAATAALWKSAGLVAPRLRDSRRGWQAFAFFFAVFMVSGFVINLLDAPLVEPAMMLGVFSMAFLTIALTGFLCHDRSERMMALAGGLLALAAVLVGSVVTGNDTEFAYTVFSILSPLVITLAYFGLGLQLTLRG